MKNVIELIRRTLVLEGVRLFTFSHKSKKLSLKELSISFAYTYELLTIPTLHLPVFLRVLDQYAYNKKSFFKSFRIQAEVNKSKGFTTIETT